MITKSVKTLSESRKLSDQFFFQAENLRAFETLGGVGAQNRIKLVFHFCTMHQWTMLPKSDQHPTDLTKINQISFTRPKRED